MHSDHFHPDSSCTAAIGDTLGKCLLTERLGNGASGVVFKAIHQSLHIPVAVKVLQRPPRAPAAGDDSCHPLQHEARTLARFSHPNIVRILDFENDKGTSFLVLEYIDGPNLCELIAKRGRLRLYRAVNIITQVVDGLAAASKNGIIHRDIKPANILLHSDGCAKLADLELAVIRDGKRKLTDHSQYGGVSGTIAYMAPEHFRTGLPFDHRSDIYSLGVTFYHAVTGKLPFAGGTPMEVMLNHAYEPVVPPHDLVPHLPSTVSRVILRMMAKASRNRYQSYDELKAALNRLVREDAHSTARHRTRTHAPKPGRVSGRSPSWWRRGFKKLIRCFRAQGN